MSCKIRSWKVSYYQNDHHQWVYGQLTCSPFDVRFHMESVTKVTQSAQGDHHQTQSKDESVLSEADDLLLRYTDIKQVQRATSMLVFPAVTLQTQDGSVHWFSSLPDRHSVFNALDYFSRHALLDSDKNAKKPTSSPAARTLLGQQLLRSAEDSERTLASAAADLHVQGRQLDRVSLTVMEMHEDLDTVDRLLSGLSAYLGQWSLPPQYKQLDLVHVSKDDVSTSDHDLEVLSSELSKDQWRPQQLSFLRVTEGGLTLLSARQRLQHTFRWVELSRVFVVSPWEMVVTKHVAGRPSVSVAVVSSALLPVLRLVERKVSHLMDYQDPPVPVSRQPPSSSSPEAVPQRESLGSKILSSRHTPCAFKGIAHGPGAGSIDSTQRGIQDQSSPQLQKKTKSDRVSEEEVMALCDKLGGLKVMAREVGGELSAQNDALDDLIGSVDYADFRVCDATRRTKKMM